MCGSSRSRGAVNAVVVHALRRQTQNVFQGCAAVPVLGDVEVARRFAQTGEHLHSNHRRPRDSLAPRRQQLLAQLVQPQRSPQRQPHPHVAETPASLQSHLVHADRYRLCRCGRRLEELPLLPTSRDLPGQQRRLGSPGGIQLTQVGHGLLHDPPAMPHRPHQTPVGVRLAVLAYRRVPEIHAPPLCASPSTTASRLVGTTRDFRERRPAIPRTSPL